MEEQQKTVRFVHNAMDKNTGAQYSGGNVRTLPESVAMRFVGVGVAEEVSPEEIQASEVPVIPVPAPHGLEDLTVQQLRDKAKAEGVDVSGAHNKAELLKAFDDKEKS